MNYNADENEKKYWKRYQQRQRKGHLYGGRCFASVDHALPRGNMREKNIKRSDVAFVLNDKEGWGETEATRAYVFDGAR